MRSIWIPNVGNIGFMHIPLDASQVWTPLQLTPAQAATATHMPLAPSQAMPVPQVTPPHLLPSRHMPVAPSQNWLAPQLTIAHLSVLLLLEPQPASTPRSNAIVENTDALMVMPPLVLPVGAAPDTDDRAALV
jgi:hypothetical protein